MYDNDCYVVSKDLTLLAYSNGVKIKNPGIEVGEKCYKAIWGNSSPCVFCPIAGNGKDDNPVFYDYKEKCLKQAIFNRTSNVEYTVLVRDVEKDPLSAASVLTTEEVNYVKGVSSGRAVNDLVVDIVEHTSEVVYANRNIFTTEISIDLDKDEFDCIFTLEWLGRIIGKRGKASQALIKLVSQVVSAPYSGEMSAFINFSTIESRINKKKIITHDFVNIAGEWHQACFIPVEYSEDNKRVTKVIFALKDLQEEATRMEKDLLTGLYSRQAFLNHAADWIKARPFSKINIISLDIKNFKLVNSIYGERKADEVLKQLAKFIKNKIPDGLYTRYGADQILCMFSSANKYTPDQYEDMLVEFCENAIVPNITLKAGIYENVDRKLSAINMCDRTLMALKSTKNTYGSSVAFYDKPFSQNRTKIQTYESRFMNAIKNHEFVVWYQPKMNPGKNMLVGAEALIRWQQEDGSIIFPGEFLGVFEKDGLISILDEYIFTSVCEQIAKWKKEGKTPVPVSINLSRESMRRTDLVERYKSIAEDYEIEPSLIPIEITENSAMSNMEIKPLAEKFFNAGFTLHMDDFGSEHSSLNGLNILHLSVLKFDKSLIDGIGTEQGNLVLEYAIALGRKLGFKIVAEGVENKDQLDFLVENGCDEIQGYYFSKPLPVGEFEIKLNTK